MDAQDDVIVPKRTPNKRKHKKVEKTLDDDPPKPKENGAAREKDGSKKRRIKKTPKPKPLSEKPEDVPAKTDSEDTEAREPEMEKAPEFDHDSLPSSPCENGVSTVETEAEPREPEVPVEIPESPGYDPLAEFADQEKSEEFEKDNLLAFFCVDHDNENLQPCARVAVVVAYSEEEAKDMLDDCLSNLRLKTSDEVPFTLIPIQRYGEPHAQIFPQIKPSAAAAKGPIINDVSNFRQLHVFASENHHCGDKMHLVSSYVLILAYDVDHAVKVMDQFLQEKGWKTSKSHKYNVISFTSLNRPKAYVLNSIAV